MLRTQGSGDLTEIWVLRIVRRACMDQVGRSRACSLGSGRNQGMCRGEVGFITYVGPLGLREQYFRGIIPTGA